MNNLFLLIKKIVYFLQYPYLHLRLRKKEGIFYKISGYPKYIPYKQSGAHTRNEYKKINYSCGVVCLNTLLAYHGIHPIKTIKFLKEAEAFGAITPEKGLIYKKTKRFLKKYSLKVKIHYYLPPKLLALRLIQSGPLMASTKNIDSGHLVVVNGVYLKKGRPQRFHIYDPETDKNTKIDIKNWRRLTNSRGLEIKKR